MIVRINNMCIAAVAVSLTWHAGEEKRVMLSNASTKRHLDFRGATPYYGPLFPGQLRQAQLSITFFLPPRAW